MDQQQNYPQGQYSQTPFNSGLQQQRSLPNATAVLVLGIISIPGCFCWGIVGLICGIIALVLAKKDLALYRVTPELFTPGSFNNLKAGRVCAIIGLCLSAIYLAYVVFLLVTIGSISAASMQEWARQMQNR